MQALEYSAYIVQMSKFNPCNDMENWQELMNGSTSTSDRQPRKKLSVANLPQASRTFCCWSTSSSSYGLWESLLGAEQLNPRNSLSSTNSATGLSARSLVALRSLLPQSPCTSKLYDPLVDAKILPKVTVTLLSPSKKTRVSEELNNWMMINYEKCCSRLFSTFVIKSYQRNLL